MRDPHALSLDAQPSCCLLDADSAAVSFGR